MEFNSKKVLLLNYLLAIFFFLIIFNVFSARCLCSESPTVQVVVQVVSPGEVQGGEKFSVEIAVNGVEDLNAASYDLVFNPELLEITGVYRGLLAAREVPVQWRLY